MFLSFSDRTLRMNCDGVRPVFLVCFANFLCNCLVMRKVITLVFLVSFITQIVIHRITIVNLMVIDIILNV